MAAEGLNLSARCVCGGVGFCTVGAPFVSATCYCSSCQEAGGQLGQLPAAPRVLDPDSGTSYLLYRRDRVTCTQGTEHLQDYRLKPDSPTRRVVATCCNSAMFLDFAKGHWLTMYRGRFPDSAPPPEMRVMTKNRPEGVRLPDDIPSYAGHSGKFMWRLLASKAAMLLGS